ncbi:MAG: T9SS type A sorting domain-containing protein [Candidatus Kapaibacterium sp.]|jgi:hypothetical protein
MQKHLILSASMLSFLLGLASSTLGQTGWIQTNGPYGASIQCLAMSSTNLFAGTARGVSLSTNNGTNWNPINTGLPKGSVIALATIGTDIFAVIGDSGVYHTSNNGTNWSAVNSGLTNRYINVLISGGTNLYAGTSCGGVFITTNRGASWKAFNAGLTDSSITAIAVHGAKVFAAVGPSCQTFAGSRGVFISTNNGISWSTVNTGLTDLRVRSLVTTGSNLIALTSLGLFVTTNDGIMWTDVTAGLPSSQISAIVSSNSIIYAALVSGVWSSTDLGTTWTMVSNDVTNATCLMISDTNIFAGTPSGVMRSTDNGASWFEVNTGLLETSITKLHSIGTKLFAAPQIGLLVFRSEDAGTSWKPISVRTGGATISTLGSNATDLFVSTVQGSTLVSTDDGASWTRSDSGLGANGISAIASIKTKVYAGTTTGVYVSGDTGKTWSAISLGSNGFVNTYSVYTLLAMGSDLVATTGDGMYNDVYFTSGSDTIWTESRWTSHATDLGWIGILALAQFDSDLFAGSEQGVYRTRNKGKSWIHTSEGLPYDFVNNAYYSIRDLALQGSNIFALANTPTPNAPRIFLSSDEGSTWTDVSAGLEAVNVLKLRVSGAYLFAATNGNGVWKRALSEMLGPNSVSEARANPNFFVLSPNPTKGIANVRSNSGQILRLSVTNMLGESILDLKGDGRTALTVDLSGRVPGPYFIKLVTTKGVSFEKLLIQ